MTVDAELLAVVRARLGDDVSFAEPPQHLAGGFFTDNYSFRLAGAPGFATRLVLRLFPSSVSPELARREEAAQRIVAAQGFPAPRIVWFEPDALIDGRHCFVMEMLPGATLMSGNGAMDLVRFGWTAATRLPSLTAAIHADLHRLDAQPLLDELGRDIVGVERWFRTLQTRIDEGAVGFASALTWLVDHRPPEPAVPVVCHGDTWGGNILMDGGRLAGVIDWGVVTVGDPLLEVGFLRMSLSLAPVALPRALQGVVARVGRGIADRYTGAYAEAAGIGGVDEGRVRYYEALRCAMEMTGLAAYRLAEASGAPHDLHPPTWDLIDDDMVRYFKQRTGVTVTLPTRAS